MAEENKGIGEGFMNWIDMAVQSSSNVYEPIIAELKSKIVELEETIESLEKTQEDREWKKFRKSSRKQSDLAYFCQLMTENSFNYNQIRLKLNSLIFKSLFDFMRDPDKGLMEVWEIERSILDQIGNSNSTMRYIRVQLSKSHKEALAFNQKYEERY